MARFNLYSAEFDANPFDTYKELRDNHPCFWSEDANKWVLTRYDDIVNALNDWQTYSSAQGNLVDEFEGRAGNTLGSMDPPRHDEVRSIVQHVFMKRNLKHLVPAIESIAHEAIEKNIKGKAVFDFAEDFAGEVTYKVLTTLLGLPESDNPEEVKRNALTMVQTDPKTRQKGPEHIAAFQWMQNYSNEVIKYRSENPGEDLVSQLIHTEVDGRKLELIQVQTTVTTLIMAGIESLAGMLKVFGYNMAMFPEARKQIQADFDLLENAIEESMRYNTSAQRFRRILTKDVTLHGETMKKGDFVILCYGSANRDERKYDNPDVYDITRKTKGHVGMGGGTHTCLGNSVARLAMKTAMEVFLKEVPEFTLAVPTDELEWVSSSNFRSPVHLPMSGS